ncbi:MAG: 3-dehydroquinate synthase [bacterium]|nr:3-dehydroquinate synthase [bacterium]
MTGHLYLAGFSGSGKTSVGKELAQRLKVCFIDLDDEIARRCGKTLIDLFTEKSEQTFRTIEMEFLNELASKVEAGDPGSVVALGGGTLINPAAQEIVRDSGKLVWLRARWNTIFERLAEVSDRPLIQKAEKLHEFIQYNRPFYEARLPGYAHCDLVLDVDHMSSNATATAITRIMDSAWFLTVSFFERTHSVLCDSGLLARTGQMLYQLGILPRGQVWLITTGTLDRDNLPLARIVKEDLESTRQEVRVLRIPDGEEAKSMEEVGRIYDALLGSGTSRDDLIIALGGGTVTDVAGFVAATYLRGIDIVQIPTTLVGMVDAALGGKTAINHERGKNLIGAYHQPKTILIDPVVLNTSADEYYMAGLAELIKYGCISDSTIIDECEENWADILNRPTWEEAWTREGWEKLKGNPWILIDLIRRGLQIKSRIVSADEREVTGERTLLNFGHTFAHGFENASGYTIPHGQAVALGMRAAFRLSLDRKLVTKDEVARMDRLLDVLAPTELIRNLKIDKTMQAIRYDKKRTRGGLKFVLPVGLGVVEIFDDVSEDQIKKALDDLVV